MLNPQSSVSVSFYWKVSGAETYHLIERFGFTMPDNIDGVDPQGLIDLYNSNNPHDKIYTYYTDDELKDLFVTLPFDPDISLGNGSTNNFKELLIYLFKPTYSGIEDNYEDLLEELGILYMPIDYFLNILAVTKTSYNSDMELTWGDIDMVGLHFDGDTFSFSPASIFPHDLYAIGQFFAMFVVLCGLSVYTYRHLFSRNSDEGGSAV